MTTIICELFIKEYKVKKVCKVSDMPKSAQYFHTAFSNGGMYDIYRTDSGVLYSKPFRL